MKNQSVVLLLLFSILLLPPLPAQAPAAPKAQPPPPPPGTPMATLEEALTPEAVIASVDGKSVTYGELEAVLKSLPAQSQQAALQDRRTFVEQYVMLRRLVEQAEKEKLDQRSPYKEAVAYSRMQVLYQAVINEKYQQTEVSRPDQQKFYDANKDRFTQAKVKVLYVSFTATPPPQTDPKAKKILNEAEAKAKIEGLLKQIRGGADFVKLVKEHSEDATSAAKDGDFGAIRKSDKIPEAIRSVIFALKAGEVSQPVRQPNGFYLFRVEELTVEPFEQVRQNIYTELKGERFKQWMESMQKGISLKIENQGFFTPKTMAVPLPAPPKPK